MCTRVYEAREQAVLQITLSDGAKFKVVDTLVNTPTHVQGGDRCQRSDQVSYRCQSSMGPLGRLWILTLTREALEQLCEKLDQAGHDRQG
jgi:hypothetical protein